MLVVIPDFVSFEMITSLDGDVKPSALANISFILYYQLKGDVIEPTLVLEKRRDRRPWWWGLSIMEGAGGLLP